MPKAKIVHIHSDIKFVDGTRGFDDKLFENQIVIIGRKGQYTGFFMDVALYYENSRSGLQSIIKFCETADIVVVYDLNFPKSYIVNRLPRSTIVIWRFFGLELYERMSNFVYSELTKRARGVFANNATYHKFKRFGKALLYLIRFQTTPEKEFFVSAFKRVDYFLGLSEKEFHFLRGIWPKLPPFLQIGFDRYDVINKEITHKTNLILLGNNRSAYNNHLDLIEGLEFLKISNEYQFLVLFNYANCKVYSDVVKERSSKIKEIVLLEDFVPLEKFKQLYSDASALVINGYRQMGMGNVFEALRKNTKIYLSEKNVMLDWLIEEGFKVFTINDFFKDVEAGSVTMTVEEAIFNQKQFSNFCKKYSRERFNEAIIEIIDRAR